MSLCINPSCSKPLNPDNNIFCQTCGSELLLAGRRYRVTHLLSDKGGFGKTYQVIDKDTPKVLKVLINNHPKAVELFQQEVQVLKKLNHPGIPKGEDSFTYFPKDSKVPVYCLVMEKIEGMDLEEYQQQRNYQPIDQKLALEWLSELASILHEVHRHKFFHRDIKPSNIILKPNGQLVLIDFGSSRQVTATIMAGGQNTGIYTPGYAPPEQEKGYAVKQSDFFALGRTFIYLLTGKEPTDSKIYDQYNNEVRWRNYAPKISPQLADFIDKLVADKANQRPADTGTILQQLADIQKQLYTPKKDPKPTPIPPNKPVVTPDPSPIIKYAGFWLRVKASIFDNSIVTILGASLGGTIGFRLQDITFLVNQGIYFSDYHDAEKQGIYWLVFTVLGTNSYLIIVSVIAGIGLYFCEPNIFSVIKNIALQYFPHSSYLAIFTAIGLGIVVKWAYFVILESSCLKATLGKQYFNLKVTDLQGKRISLGTANKRYWGKIFSLLILFIGFMLAGWTKKKRALHDIISGTVIVKNSD